MSEIKLNYRMIADLVAEDKFIISNHARVRMFQRNITTEILKSALKAGEFLEQYPDDKPCPSALIFGLLQNNPIHIVVAQCEDHVRIITVYRPDKDKWIDFRKRKD